MTGTVYLIGAGPGDAGLLTQKAARLLAQAEVVVYDRLVGEEVLALMPEAAEKINVGKQAGHHPVPQDEINLILLQKANEGKRVVRLKGGDCFLFGRGGEELELLAEHGVPFEVVPGVPSPIAATAYAGIPVTHRDYCASVHFITGHRKKDGALNLDYASLVRLDGTLVFLMSVASCEEIMQGLMAHGMPPDMDCAVIENGTRPEQRKFVSTVRELAQTVRTHNVVSPALLVVGRVCALSDRFDWFSRLPLHGKRVLVTSPSGSASRLRAELQALGARVSALPAIETVPLACAIPPLSGFQAVAFTSPFGVECFFARLADAGKDARALSGLTVCAVGARTAQALAHFGIRADLVPASYSGEALGHAMTQSGAVQNGQSVLLARARQGAPELSDILAAHGISVCELPLYETRQKEMDDFCPADYDWITFTSASGADSFARMCKTAQRGGTQGLSALCIGEKTAERARALGMRVSVAKQATIHSMIEFLREAAQ